VGIRNDKRQGRRKTQLSKIFIPEKKKAAHGDMSRLGGRGIFIIRSTLQGS
jgi:hypothetical protein